MAEADIYSSFKMKKKKLIVPVAWKDRKKVTDALLGEVEGQPRSGTDSNRRISMAKRSRKGMVEGNAESRWGLSKRFRPEAPSTPNEHLIQDMIVSYGMERAEILEKLLLYPRNLDCIIDNQQRAEVAKWLGIKESPMNERVLFVKDQIARSSGTGEVWAALLDGDKIVNLSIYHQLRFKRLDEQVGRALTQEKYRRNKQTANEDKGGSLVMKVEHIGEAHIKRDHTGLEGFDLLGGQDRKNPNSIGWCVGDLILVGGEAGVGKTKMLLMAMAIASGPFVNDTALYMQSEFDLETFKARYCEGVIQGDEDLYISSANTTSDIIEAIYQVRPRWVVIDSKDKVVECRTSAGWDRFQHRLRQVARDIKCTVFIVTHLNQGKDIYGGNRIKHDVDAVMLLTKEDGIPNCFKACIPSKNRGGIANKEHFGIWFHIGPKVVCTKRPPRWMQEMVDTGNPLMETPPETITDEEKIRKEMDELLGKLHDKGMDGLSDAEKDRLAHISEWMTKRDSKEYQEKAKEIRKKKRQEERDEDKREDKGPFNNDDDPPLPGDEWKKR
jgi:hypothetical protein